MDVRVTVLEELGSDSHVIFPIDAPRVDTDAVRAAAEDADDASLAEATSLFNARIDPQSHARAGDRLTLAVDPARFQFFDPQTGANLGRG